MNSVTTEEVGGRFDTLHRCHFLRCLMPDACYVVVVVVVVVVFTMHKLPGCGLKLLFLPLSLLISTWLLNTDAKD